MTKRIEIETTSDDPQGDHYAEICGLSHEVAAALREWQAAKEDAAEKKRLYDRLADNLLTMIEGGPDWQKTLEFGDE